MTEEKFFVRGQAGPLVAVACVYNEGDIIESFCRYHAAVFDSLIIYDRGCEDDSPEIIRRLTAEGLPIHLLTELRPHPVAGTYKASLVDLAFGAFGAGLVFPLDPDEFLYHADGLNPREELRRLRVDREYQVLWRTAIFDREPGAGKFLPAAYGRFRSPRFEKFAKPLISRNLYDQYGATVGRGVHHLDYPRRPAEDRVEVVVHDKLFLAHYPVRSPQQMLTKIVPSRIDHKYQNDHATRAFHQALIYDVILNKGLIGPADLKRLSLEYALETKDIPDEIPSCPGVLETNFAGDMGLRYTSRSPEERLAGSLKVILNYFEKAADRYQADKKELAAIAASPLGRLAALLRKAAHFIGLARR